MLITIMKIALGLGVGINRDSVTGAGAKLCSGPLDIDVYGSS